MSQAVSSHCQLICRLKSIYFLLMRNFGHIWTVCKGQQICALSFCSTLHFKTPPVAYKRRPHLTHPTLWCRYRHVPRTKGVNVSSHHELRARKQVNVGRPQLTSLLFCSYVVVWCWIRPMSQRQWTLYQTAVAV